MLAAMVYASVRTGGTKVFVLCMAFLTLAVTSRLLGPSGRGVVGVLTTWMLLFSTLGHLSLGQVALSEAQRGDRHDRLRAAAWLFGLVSVGVSAFVVGGLAVLVVAGAPTPFADVPTPYLVVTAVALPITMLNGYATYLLLALDRLSDSNRAQIGGAATLAGASVLLVAVVNGGIAGALLAYLLSQIVMAALAGRALVRAGLRRPRRDGAVSRRLLSGGVRLHANAIGAFLFASLDILMIDAFRGKQEAGLYQVAFQLFVPLLLVPQALTEVLSSRLPSLGVRTLWLVQRKLVLTAVAVATAAAVLLFAAAPLVVRLVAGPDFAASAELYRIYLLAAPAAVWNGSMAVQWIGRGLYLQTSLVTLAAGALNAGANLLLIPKFGAAGAAWATVAGVYAIPFTANLVMWRRCERERRVGLVAREHGS